MKPFLNPFKPILLSILVLQALSCSSDNGDNTKLPDPVNETPKEQETPEPEANNSPSSFDLSGIANNLTDSEVLPTLSWGVATDPDGDSVAYDLYLDSSETPEILYEENLTDTTFEVSERLNLSTRYYWKVIAKDGKGGSTESEVFTFETRGLRFSSEAEITSAPFSARYGHTTVVFDNKIWVIGGSSSSGGLHNDVWNSSDGVNWVEVTSSASFSPRFKHTSAVFDDKIWVICGSAEDGSENDVWYSSDGIDWQLATANTFLYAQTEHSTAVFDNQLWVITQSYNPSIGDVGNVWHSSNGTDWQLATFNAPFSERLRNTFTTFDNKLWVIGGFDDKDGEVKNDVWSSTDGINWVEVTENAPFSPREDHSAVAFDDKLWVIGGYDRVSDSGGHPNDVWYSSDGLNWEKTSEQTPFAARRDQTSVVFDNKIWLIGGWNFNFFNDVWTMD